MEQLTRENYYDDADRISFSALKVFSKCEQLYKEVFMDHTYEEPDHDYFTYGKLVDALVTEDEKYVKENFVRVERKVKVEDTLKIQNAITTLENEIKGLAEKIAKNNKTAIKGKESREKKIEEFKVQLHAIESVGAKTQVTASIWKNAEETALALKTHPYFSNMEFNELTSQQVLAFTNEDGIPRKGRLDHLKLSPQIEAPYAIYLGDVAKADPVNQRKIYAEFRAKIDPLPVDKKWARITDVKTCFDIAKLEPYNTHYRGQLGFYQDLVHDFFGIPTENIQCLILAADKLSSAFKKAELFEYTQRSLDELKPTIYDWMRIWKQSINSGIFQSAKEVYGIEQKCFTCSACRFSPFAKRLGEPYLVDAPRFKGSTDAGENEVSITDAVLEY